MNKKHNLSTLEASKRLKVSERSITRYIRQGKLKATTEITERGLNRYLIAEQDLIDFKTDKDNKDKRLAGGQTEANNKVENDKTNADNQTDSNTDRQNNNDFIGYLKAENKELKGEVKDLHQQVNKLAFDVGSLTKEIKLLAKTTQTDNQTDNTENQADNSKKDDDKTDLATKSDKQTENKKDDITPSSNKKEASKRTTGLIIGVSILIIVLLVGFLIYTGIIPLK